MKAKTMYTGPEKEFSQREKSRMGKIVRIVSADVTKMFGARTHVNITFVRSGRTLRGLAQAKDRVVITVPKGAINYTDLEALLYHELHHIVRGYTEHLEKGKHFLLNPLFSEGLAMTLEIEKRPKSRRIVHGRYSPALVRKWLPRMKKDLHNTKV